MRTVKFTSIFLAVFAGLFALSCNKQKEDEKVEEARDVKFSISVNRTGVDAYELIVRHDGKDSDTWYGFLVDDMTSAAQSMIYARLAEVDKNSIHVGKSQTIVLKDLVDRHDYRYIAFGVTLDKVQYGTIGDYKFTTDPDRNKAQFQIDPKEVGINSATVEVRHFAYDDFTWVCFASTDFETELNAQVSAYFNKAGKEALQTGKQKEVTIENLEEDTQYQIIIGGVTEDGIVYGTPSSIVIRTEINYDAAKFAVESTGVTKTSSTIKVSYTGSNATLPWYGFNTSDMDGEVIDLVNAKVKAGIPAEEIQEGNNVEVKVDNLEALTNYRYIVFGVKDGKLYGTPGSVTYQTADEDYDAIKFNVELVGDPTKTGAVLKVTHDGGDDKFQWFGVLTDDLTKAAAELLPKAEEVKAEDVKSGQEVEVTLSELTAGTEYRYLVAGYRVDGSGNKYVYGVPGDLKFSTASFFSENSAWKLTYSGKRFNKGYYRNLLKVEGIEGSYGLLQLSKADFEAAGLDKAVRDEYQDILDYVAASSSATLANQFYSQNTTWYRPYDGPGDYVEIAYGVNANDNYSLTGDYAVVSFSIEAAGTSAAYEAWLGKWQPSDSAGSEIWNVTAKVPGESYTITGLAGAEDIELVAYFNADDATLNLSEQATGVIVNVNNAPAEVRLMGMYSNNTKLWGGTGWLFSAKISGETATLTPQKVPSTADNGNYTGCQFFSQPLSGGNSVYYYNRVLLDFTSTLKRPSETGSEAYNAWLGTWSIPRNGGTDTWVISKDVADVSYTITGIEGLTDRVVKAKFVESTGEMSVSVQEGLKTYTDTDGTSINDHLYGEILYQGDNYYITGSYVIFTGSVNGNSATLKPGTVSLEGIGDMELVGMIVLAYDPAAGKVVGGYLQEGEEFTALPNTLTKVSGSTSSFGLQNVRMPLVNRSLRGKKASKQELVLNKLSENTKVDFQPAL